MVAMLRDETLRRRRRRAAAVAVLSIALGSALFLPMRHTAPLPHGAAYAAIAGRAAATDPFGTLAIPGSIRMLAHRAAVPRAQPIPRAMIDYTPMAEAAVAGTSTTFAPLALAALDGAPGGGAYFPGDSWAPVARAGDGFALGSGAFANHGGSGNAGGGATPTGDTVATPPTDEAGRPTPSDPGTTPAMTDPAAPPGSNAPSTTPPTDVVTPAPADVGTSPKPTDPSPVRDEDKVAPPAVDAAAVVRAAFTSGDASTIGRGPLAPTSPAANSPSHVVAAVPEPATWTMLLIGFGATGAAIRRRRRARALA